TTTANAAQKPATGRCQIPDLFPTNDPAKPAKRNAPIIAIGARNQSLSCDILPPAPNARLWGGLVAAKRRKGRPSPEGATTADCYAIHAGHSALFHALTHSNSICGVTSGLSK